MHFFVTSVHKCDVLCKKKMINSVASWTHCLLEHTVRKRFLLDLCASEKRDNTLKKKESLETDFGVSGLSLKMIQVGE